MSANVVYGQDNDSYAFRGYPVLTEFQHIHQELAPDMSGKCHSQVHRCANCGQMTAKWVEPLAGVKIKNRKFDLSITFDGILVSSQRFKATYERGALLGLEFHQLPADPEFFSVLATRVVGFDSERRKTRFIKHCAECGQYESVVGATPVFLKPCQIGDREFVRTDLEFGSGDEKHPLLLCGDEAANALLHEKLSGLDITSVE